MDRDLLFNRDPSDRDPAGQRAPSPGQTASWTETPGQRPSPPVATAAVGTHPTGMHSCL